MWIFLFVRSFSFGMVLWVLIRQRRPWSNASDREVMYRVCRGERPCLNRADIASPVLSKVGFTFSIKMGCT